MRQKEFRTFKLELRDIDPTTGHIEGYASVFNTEFPVWDHMETVKPGAFKRTLNANGGKVPVLFNHYSGEWIGNASSGEENDHGLFVKADLLVEKVQRAREIFALAQDAMSKGMKVGISIGFETISDTWATVKTVKTRALNEIALWEWSICQWPANPDALVTDVRSVDGLANTIVGLTDSEREKLFALLTPQTRTLEPATLSVSSDSHDAEILNKFLETCRGK